VKRSDASKHYSGCHNAKEEEDDQGKEIETGKCGQRASDLAGGRYKTAEQDCE